MMLGDLVVMLLDNVFSATDQVSIVGKKIVVGRGAQVFAEVDSVTGIVTRGVDAKPDNACDQHEGS